MAGHGSPADGILENSIGAPERKSKSTAFTLNAMGADGSTVGLHDLSYYRESQTFA